MDQFGLVQQVQGLVESYVRVRDEKSALEDKVFQLNQDLKRIQQNMASLVAENDRLKAQ